MKTFLIIIFAVFLTSPSNEKTLNILHLSEEEELFINDKYYFKIYDKIILEDGSSIILGENVVTFDLTADRAEIGEDVEISRDYDTYDGTNGRRGSNATSRDRAGDCANGYSGRSGESGTNGVYAPNINLSLTFTSLGSLIIDATGGDGGDGGNGGDGMSGTKGDCSSMCTGGNGGNGGNAGNGGNGGDGGNVLIKYRFLNGGSIGYVEVETDGGEGGSAGNIGYGAVGGARKSCTWKIYSKGQPGRNGSSGYSGSSGSDGKYKAIKLIE